MGDAFSDLPDALVRDLLAAAAPLAADVKQRIDTLSSNRGNLRRLARDSGLVRRKADLDVPREPSVVGIDGSYQIHRLTSLELCAAAAVAIEGTSKEAIRHWPEPHHRMWAAGVPHSVDVTGVLRAVMVAMEFDLANEAPHDLVLLDGSFASLIIYLNQGLASVADVDAMLAGELRRRWTDEEVLARLLQLLQSDRTVAVPKVTSRNELVIGGRLPACDGIDGRTLATIILEPGEYTAPLPVYDRDPDYHLPPKFCPADQQRELNVRMRQVCAVYYRPYGWVPALRLELPLSIANSLTRTSIVLDGLARQYFSPAVVEPYPLFLADRMVKSLGSGVSVIEQTVAQHVVDGGVDVELAMLCLQNYRTEGGRGGN